MDALPTFNQAFMYAKDTTVYGRLKVWHVVAFFVLGPTLTWPMLALLLMVFMNEARNAFKDVRAMITTNGEGSTYSAGGGDQVPASRSAQGEAASG
jgi:hypothetical protein